jgi:dynamin 1-like protein
MGDLGGPPSSGLSRGIRSPDPSREDRSASNPLYGRKGHEGAAAAFDMKSLDRHLDAESLPSSYENQQSTGEDDMHIDLIQSLISTYFDIVRQTIQDLVPKAVMHLLINHSRDSVQTRLVESLYKESLFSDLLHEDEGLTAERARVKALLDSYKEGFKVSSHS